MRYKILLCLFVLSLISSLILSITPLSEICKPGEGCDAVQNSVYAYTFGVKNSVYGIGIFSFFSLLALIQIFKHSRKIGKLIKFLLIISSSVAVYFFVLQIFIIHAYCKYCIIVDLSVILALIVVYLPKRKINFV